MKSRGVRSSVGVAIAVLLLGGPPGAARALEVADAEVAAIKQTALDYIEGYYDGNVARMERALHPDLAKRVVRFDQAANANRLVHMGALALIQRTRARAERPTPKEAQQKDVTVLDALGNAATVRIVAADWVDYLHVARVEGRWVIVNVLWELKPGR